MPQKHCAFAFMALTALVVILQFSRRESDNHLAPEDPQPPAGQFAQALEQGGGFNRVPYGKEFWRGAAPSPDFTGAVDRVRHAFEVDAAGGRVRSEKYEFRLGAGGAAFHPRSIREDESLWLQSQGWVLDGAAKALQPSAWEFIGNTGQRSLDPSGRLVEHWQATGQGVEVTWLIAAKPQASRVRISASVTGLSYAGRNPKGHSFTDAASQAVVSMSEVVAVDAAGQRWELESEVVGSLFEVVVPEQVLASATFPLAIDPWITAETEAGDSISSPSSLLEFNPDLASLNGRFLAVFVQAGFNGVNRLRGTFVSADGQIIDRDGLDLTSSRVVPEYSPVVAASSLEYLVLYTTPTNGIMALRLTAEGSPIGEPRFTGLLGVPHHLIAAHGGFILAFFDSQFSTLKVQRLDLSGAKLGDGVSIPGRSVSIAASASGSLALFDQRTNLVDRIFALPLNTSGAPLFPEPVQIAEGPAFYLPVVASDGTNYLAAWRAQPGPNDTRNSSIAAALLSSSGTILQQKNLTSPAELPSNHVLWHDGALFHLAFRRGNTNMALLRANSQLEIATPEQIVYSGRNSSGSLMRAASLSAGKSLVLWSEWVNRDDVLGLMLNPQPLFVGALAFGPNQQSAPVIAPYPGGCFLVWQDYRNYLEANQDIYGARLSSEGVILDPAGIPISRHPASQTTPAVAYANGQFLVAWRDLRNLSTTEDDIFGARVSVTGAVLDPAGFPICEAPEEQRAVAVTASGSQYLVVWRDDRNNQTSVTNVPIWLDDIYAARVSFSGEVLDRTGIAIAADFVEQGAPAVASIGTNFMVVWREFSQPLGEEIMGNLVLENGQLARTNAVVISGDPAADLAPEIAAGRTNYLVVWRSGLIRAKRISASGIPDEQSATMGAPRGNNREPDAAFDGSNFAVGFIGGNRPPFDIYTATINPATGARSSIRHLKHVTYLERDVFAIEAFGPNRYVAVIETLDLVSRSRAILFRFSPEFSSVTLAPTGVWLTWQTTAGLTYSLEVSDGLGSFRQRTTLQGTGEALSFLQPFEPNARKQFYRVVELP